MKLGEVQQVLQTVAPRGVSRSGNLGPILETLGDYAPRTQDPVLLAEHVRRRLARTICRAATATGTIVCTSSRSIRRWKNGFATASTTTRKGCGRIFAARSGERVPLDRNRNRETLRRWTGRRSCWSVPSIRPAVKQLTAAHLPDLIVLSYGEITRDTKIEAVGMAHDAMKQDSAKRNPAIRERYAENSYEAFPRDRSRRALLPNP